MTHTTHASQTSPLMKDDFLLSSVSLGMLWVWLFFAGNFGDSIFGLATQNNAEFRTAYQLFAAAAFLALSFCKMPFSRVPYKAQVVAGSLGCIAAGVLFRLNVSTGVSALFVLSSLMVAVSYAVLLRCWMTRYQAGFGHLLLVVFSASTLCFLVHLSTFVFSSALSFPLAVAASLTVLVTLTRGHAAQIEERSPKPSAIDDFQFYTQLAGIVLCTLAGNMLHFGVMGNFEPWAYISLVGSFCLAVLMARKGDLSPSTLFVGLALFGCASIISDMIPALPAAVGSSLATTGFWLLFIYAIAWLAARDLERSVVPCQLFLRGMAALLLCTAVAKMVRPLLPESPASLLICTLLTTVALALYFIGSTRQPQSTSPHPSNPGESVAESTPVANLASIPDERLKAIAAQHHLTEREEALFTLLAHGNSLKKIADLLSISEGTAKYHRHNVYSKLGISTRQELVDLATADADTVS